MNLRRQIAIPFVAAIFLAFVGGAFVADFKTFPYSLMFRQPFNYIHAARERKKDEAAVGMEVTAWKEAPRVTIPAGPEAYDGYTFMTSNVCRPSTALLLDMQGNIIHQWHRDFREIWPDHPHKDDPSPETAISWRYGKMFPNGDIIVVVKGHGDTPEGYGLAKLDKDSKVIWSVPDNFHHQFSIADDGRIFGLVHRWRDTRIRPLKNDPAVPDMMLEDFVVELSPQGKEISRVSLLDAFDAPEYAAYLHSGFDGHGKHDWDPLHPNDVEVVGDAFASHHAFTKPGMVLVSLRDLDSLVFLDMKTGGITWSVRSVWKQQHDPDLLDNGNILLFDNRGLLFDNRRHPDTSAGSRVVEFDPSSGRIVWTYTGSKQAPFFSYQAGGQERLPNGNTLIAEDETARLFEVTREGKIVWEYRDNGVRNAQRVTKDWIQFTPKGETKTGGVAVIVK